jgi:enoyl-CoA hydratase/carnithine racemase
LTETKDAIGTIVMNHAQKRNALSEALIGEITVALECFREKDIRAAVLRAPVIRDLASWAGVRCVSRHVAEATLAPRPVRSSRARRSQTLAEITGFSLSA